MKLTTLAIVALIAFAGCKESPEAAAKRIRDTMEAMDAHADKEYTAKSAALFATLNDHASEIKEGMAESDAHKLIGPPMNSRKLADGSEAQVWLGKSGDQSATVILVVRDRAVESVEVRR